VGCLPGFLLSNIRNSRNAGNFLYTVRKNFKITLVFPSTHVIMKRNRRQDSLMYRKNSIFVKKLLRL